jgi:tetratricopeptide (TPR) repeat protein
MFDLKPIAADAVPAAVEKAHRYRLLNEPVQAESICEDVLRIDPDNQDALVTLLLAHTDRFDGPRPVPPQAARELLPRLHGEYERAYYAGIVWEREGIAWLRSDKPRAGRTAYHCLREAMECYERAEAVRPMANDDALLRWNSCARLIQANPDLVPDEDRLEVAASLGE